MKRNIHSLKSGFTLVELLVALALLGILGGSISGVLHNASSSVEQGTAAMDQLTRLRALETILGGALRDARVMTVSAKERSWLADEPTYDAADGRYRFRGEELALGFVLDRPFLEAERDGYLHWISIEVRIDEDTAQSSLWMTDTAYLEGIRIRGYSKQPESLPELLLAIPMVETISTSDIGKKTDDYHDFNIAPESVG